MSELVDRAAQPHKVTVKMGYTKNLGDFDSLRIDIGLEIEGKPTETPTQTYERAVAWVESKFSEQFADTIKQVRELQRGQRSG